LSSEDNEVKNMKLWFVILISITFLATLTKYVLNYRKDSNKKFFVNTFGPALALEILFATLTSLAVFYSIKWSYS
jgi:hypothetical protein